MSFSLAELPDDVSKLYVAFSGGVDSLVLLHILVQARLTHGYQLTLWHINHGLQVNADLMEQLARDTALQLDVEVRIDHLNLSADSANLEAVARHARYDLFASVLESDSAVLTAHHMNDQAETLLLNLMRGSGAAGLRAIARIKALGRGWLYRPMLGFQREAIERYALENQLQWIEDPSNQDIQFDRNYLRHEILPVLSKRWPSAVNQIHMSSEWQQEQYELMEDLAGMDYQQIRQIDSFSALPCLDVTRLLQLSSARQKNLIRYWVKSCDLDFPGYKKLAELLAQLASDSKANPRMDFQGYSLRRYAKLLFIVLPVQVEQPRPEYQLEQDDFVIEELGLQVSRQQAFAAAKISDQGQSLCLRFRQPGAAGEGRHSHRLKRLFQQHRVPPWIRSYVPQVIIDDDLQGLLL